MPTSPAISLGPQPVRLRTLATFASSRELLRRGERCGREERSERHERSSRWVLLASSQRPIHLLMVEIAMSNIAAASR